MARQVRLLAAIVLIALAAAFAFGFGPLQIISYNPDTVPTCVYRDAFKDGILGGGHFPDPDLAADVHKRGELWDSSSHFYSWSDIGTGETMVVGGKTAICGGKLFVTSYRYARYVFTINTGFGFEPFIQDDVPGGIIQFDTGGATTYTLNARTIKIDGTSYQAEGGTELPIRDGSILRAALEIAQCINDCGIADMPGWFEVARDETRLKSAVPSLQWGNTRYLVNETAELRWRIPVVTIDGAAAYALTIIDMNSNQPLSGYNFKPLAPLSCDPDQPCRGVERIPVATDMWQRGGINRLRAEIWSQIFLAGMQDVATQIDKVVLPDGTVIPGDEAAPIIRDVRFSKPEYREGDTVTINITAVPNPLTESPIKQYYVSAHIGGLVLFDGFSARSTVSFLATATGVLEAEVTAHSEDGLNSAVWRAAVTVGNVIVVCEVYPELPECGGGGGGGAFGIGVALALVLLVVGMALLLVGASVPLPVIPRIAAIAVGAVLALMGLVVLFVVLISFLEEAFPSVGG